MILLQHWEDQFWGQLLILGFAQWFLIPHCFISYINLWTLSKFEGDILRDTEVIKTYVVVRLCMGHNSTIQCNMHGLNYQDHWVYIIKIIGHRMNSTRPRIKQNSFTAMFSLMQSISHAIYCLNIYTSCKSHVIEFPPICLVNSYISGPLSLS